MTVRIFNVDFECASLDSGTEQIIAAARSGRKGLVVTPNVDHVVVLQDDPEMQAIYREALFRFADGMPLVWFSKLACNTPLPERVTGADLLPAICQKSAGTGLNLYFLGGNPGIAERAADSLRRQYPGVAIVGTYCPPFGFEHDPAETERIIADINACQVDILFVGVGAPKQEKWAAACLSRLNVGPILCIGAAFDFAAGSIRRAPKLLRNAGLEWVWRMASEPRRLWKRYLVRGSRFLPMVWRELGCRRQQTRSVSILGTRGIPARHGGFETFAEQLALYLAARGWNVTVYCQNNGADKRYEEIWNGIRLIHIPVRGSDTIGSIYFDWKSILHVLREKSLVLTLGYNTAIFSVVHRLAGVTNLINMDGFEWRRQKWSLPQRAWLYLNERLACLLGNHLIADHPLVQAHLETRVAAGKITMIPYPAEIVDHADASLLEPFGLEPGSYVLVVARPEPENSILEIVTAFSSRPRGYRLVLVGAFDVRHFPYHARVQEAAGGEVSFLGAIYHKETVAALRYFCRMYIHGHQVGGTNPSLLESMAAGAPVLAHDNQFNHWVAGSSAHYFRDVETCAGQLDRLLPDTDLLRQLGSAGRARCEQVFAPQRVLSEYEELLQAWWAREATCGAPARCRAS